MACHRNHSALDAVPKYRLDGAYAFTITGEGVVDRYGTMVVTRGLPGASPDTGRRIQPTGSRPLRIRCDTSADGPACSREQQR
jgi:hypothetical protein